MLELVQIGKPGNSKTYMPLPVIINSDSELHSLLQLSKLYDKVRDIEAYAVLEMKGE